MKDTVGARTTAGPSRAMTLEALASHWFPLGIDDDEARFSKTIRPRDDERSSKAELDPARFADAALLRLPPIEEALQLERGELLGRGGMGEVYSARQGTLGRDVAVKVALSSGGSLRARHLLREAWAMGALEHPNVVPVHQLGLDERGEPQIVMKKIAGTSLLDRLQSESRQPGDQEALSADLDALMEVARALEFAHSRGVIHRDVKPENVMIGEYGEVYLLDWGIAVGTSEEHRARLRMADDVVNPEGTPSYMAPEMINRSLGPIDERTDVYLLGGTLHEILTGRPPHVGETLMAVIGPVVLDECNRTYPESAPKELIAIVERAMSYAAADRFQSAGAFRLAIVEAVRHGASRALADESAQRLSRLVTALAADPTDEAAARLARDLFTEGVFGCEQALSTWPDNELARSTRRRLVATMGRAEFENGRIESAAGVLARIEDPPPDLLADLEEAVAERERAQVELAARRHDEDLTVASKIRVGLMWTLALLTTSYSLSIALLGPAQPLLHGGGVAALGTGLLLLAATVLGFSSTGRALLRNQANRRILTATIATLVAMLLTRIYGTYHGESFEVLATRTMLLWSMTAGLLGATVDRRFFAAGGLALTSWLGAVALPDQTLYCTAFGYFTSFAVLAIGWRNEAIREAAASRGPNETPEMAAKRD